MARTNSTKLYLRLLRHVLPYRRVFLFSLLAMVIAAAAEPALPALLKPLLDGSFVENDLGVARLIAPLLVLAFLVRGGAGFAASTLLAWVSGKLVMDLRAQMFEKVLSLPASYHDQHPSGKLISKLTFNVTQLAECATHALTVVVRDSLIAVGLLAYMLIQDWRLSLIVIATTPLIVYIVKRLSRRLRRMSRNLQRSMGDVTQTLQESIEGHPVVRVYGGQDYERKRFRNCTNLVRRFQYKFAIAAAAASPLAEVTVAIALSIIIFAAATQSAAGQITVGGFVSFFAAMTMLFPPLKRLTRVNSRIQRGLAAADSVFRLLDEHSEADRGTRDLGVAAGRIEIRDVGFSYESSAVPALSDITLQLAEGETVALVGPSGSGKSTLSALIPRLYNPSTGKILIDGIDSQELTLSSLRRNIAVVSQDVVLFNDTIAANIAYGPLAGKSVATITAAAEAANAMNFIRQLPNGLETTIGDNGVRLSGGQRQRLALARAFLKDAPILILDEATSSLDSNAERSIQSALERLREQRTTLVIAHRLSTIENADRIAVMADGRIVETGKHAELLKRSRLYAGLYRFQFSSENQESTASGNSRRSTKDEAPGTA